MDEDSYYKMPTELLSCSGFLSKRTGEAIGFTSTAKLVLVYMMSRTRFFSEVLSSDHYETQVTIAAACGVEYKAVAKALSLFVEHGVIEAEKVRNTKISPHKCWYYKSVDSDLILVHTAKIKRETKTKEQPTKIQEEVPGAVDDFTDEFMDNL